MAELTNILEFKEASMRRMLQRNEVDVWKLREFALREGGLINDTIRREVWPLLVGIRRLREGSSETSVVPCSDDVEIIQWDVSRCWHLLSRKEREQKNLLYHMRDHEATARAKAKQRGLADLINALMIHDRSDLFYFQGFHELASIFFNILCPIEDSATLETNNKEAKPLDLSLPITLMSELSRSHWSDLLKEDFSNLDTMLQVSLFPLLARLDPQVHEHLSGCSMHPTFAVSWIITWFSHDIRDTNVVKRLFDFFLASHPLMAMYVAVAMITHPTNRERILDTELEYSEIYAVLRELPKHSSTETVADAAASMDEDPFAESVGSTASESGFSLDARSKECSTFERVFHDIAEETESQLRDDSQGSSSSHFYDSFVPIEEVLDIALEYMTSVPPVKLLSLASKYNWTEESEKLVLNASTISMFNSPPAITQDSRVMMNSLAFTALGCGPEVEAHRRRATQRKCLSLSLLAALVFAWTCHLCWCTLVSGTGISMEWIGARGKEQPILARLSGLTARLETASRLVLGSAVCTYRKGGSAVSTYLKCHSGSACSSKLSLGFSSLEASRALLQNEVTLDLDEDPSELIPNDFVNEMHSTTSFQFLPQLPLEKSPCLKNDSSASYHALLLSSTVPLSTSHCLVSWALAEYLSDRRRTGPHSGS